MADVSVRPARPPDAELVARVQLATWQRAYRDLLPADALALPVEQVAAVWLNAIEAPPSPRHRLLVALDAGEVVGFAASEPAADEPDATELSALLVEPSWGRRGHGSRLLAACVEHWRGEGVGLALTWVFTEDAATTSFLQTSGWEPDGLRRGLDTGEKVVSQQRWHVDVAQPLA